MEGTFKIIHTYATLEIRGVVGLRTNNIEKAAKIKKLTIFLSHFQNCE
jgi:hypothetical protein